MKFIPRPFRPMEPALLLLISCSMNGEVGCSARGADDAATTSQAVMGPVTFDNSGGSDCGPEQPFLLDSIAWGRTIAASDVFESCVTSAMNGPISLTGDVHLSRASDGREGPYDVCSGDPTPWNKVGAVIEDTRSPLGIRISCSPNTNGGELAHAAITTNPGPNETLTYLEPRLVASLNSQDPFLVAATIWHEAMHQHGYVHGNGKAEDCGYSASQFTDDDSSWMMRHTVPYIVGACMTYIGDISGTCTLSCPGGKPVRTALDPTSPCECRLDPRSKMSTNVAPAVASTPDGVLFFATDTVGRIYQNRVVLGQASQGWLELEGSGRTDAAPAAALVGNNPYVFTAIKGLNGYVYVNQGGLGGQYVGWQSDYAFETKVAPAVATTPDGVLFFAIDLQGRILFNRAVLGQAGQGWVEVGGNGRTDASPAAALVGNTPYIFAAVKGLDGYIYINQADLGGPWVGWRSDYAFQTDVAPAVATTPDGVIFFAKDLHGRILSNRVVLGQAGQGWVEVGGNGRTNAAPAAALVGDNPYIFAAVKGYDGHFYLNQAGLGASWVGWQQD